MTAGAHARCTRLAAALLAAAALLPALHAAASHQLHAPASGVSVDAAACEEGHGLSPDVCTICLATRSVQGKALRAQPHAPHAITLAPGRTLPATPPVAGRVAPGAASPRAPPST